MKLHLLFTTNIQIHNVTARVTTVSHLIMITNLPIFEYFCQTEAIFYLLRRIICVYMFAMHQSKLIQAIE